MLKKKLNVSKNIYYLLNKLILKLFVLLKVLIKILKVLLKLLLVIKLIVDILIVVKLKNLLQKVITVFYLFLTLINKDILTQKLITLKVKKISMVMFKYLHLKNNIWLFIVLVLNIDTLVTIKIKLKVLNIVQLIPMILNIL